MVDWKKLAESWDLVSEDMKRKLEASFVAKRKQEKLEEFFKANPDARLVYDKIFAPPPAAPPVVAPPPAVAPPPKAPPKVVPAKVPPVLERGLQKADEKRLLDRFESILLERGITPARWRPMFNDVLYEWRDVFRDLSRSEALERGFSEVERLVGRVMELSKVAPKIPIAVPAVRPEEVPAVPPFIIAPFVVPPVGVERLYGMPWTYFACPAHLGEGEEVLVLRSKFLEDRLRRIGLPTHDRLFFELCDDHRQKYGGAFEKFPRYKVEFWVGEALEKGELDISVLVGMGVSEAYCHYCVAFYLENQHLAVQ